MYKDLLEEIDKKRYRRPKQDYKKLKKGKAAQFGSGIHPRLSSRGGASGHRRSYVHFRVAYPKGGKGTPVSKDFVAGFRNYIGREGVGPSGTKPELFTAEGSELNFDESRGEKRLFFVILSPEPSAGAVDMQAYTREFMTKLSRSTHQSYEWFAAVHYNTDTPHAHVVIRGVDKLGKDLLIDPWYIKHGAREIALEILDLELGPKTEAEREYELSQEIHAYRITSIDRVMAKRLNLNAPIPEIDLWHTEFKRMQHLAAGASSSATTNITLSTVLKAHLLAFAWDWAMPGEIL